MANRLLRIKNWTELAAEVRYSPAGLARQCGVCLRQLERFFLQTHGALPKNWLSEIRMARALELLQETGSIKEVSHLLGFKQPSHFSQEFKRRHGVSASDFLASMVVSPEQMSRFDKRCRDSISDSALAFIACW